MRQYPTKEQLHKLLAYNPSTGIFTWKIDINQMRNGMVAGTPSTNGYIAIRIGTVSYLAHRLAWVYVNDILPKTIDHINHDKSDNRINNLRDVTHSCNHKNKTLQTNNTSGVQGVDFMKSKNKYRARIKVHGKEIHLGMFTNIEDAISARTHAKNLYSFHEHHH